MNSRADIAATSAEDAALRWLIDFDDLSEADRERFRTWLGERPENRDAFERAERDWRKLDVVRQLATDVPDPKVVDKWLWRRRLQRLYLPLAAVIGVAAAAVALLLLPRQGYEASYRTAIGQYEEFVLPDESVIVLNTGSEAKVHYAAGERRVRLERGEAYFVVAPEPGRPFSVEAGSGTVRAVGTAFNVYLKEDAVEVTVTEGTVEVFPGPLSAVDGEAGSPSAPPEGLAAERLGKNRKVEYRETIGPVSSVDPKQIARKLAWQHGMLDFDRSTLAEVVEEAGRYTATRIVIDDPEIEELEVTAYLRAGDVETLLELIESNEPVTVRRAAADLVHLSANRD